MRDLTKEEIDVLLFPQKSFYIYEDKKIVDRHGRAERRLKNLGLLKVDIPRIPGYQRTLYTHTKKGWKLSRDFVLLRRFNRKLRELKAIVNFI